MKIELNEVQLAVLMRCLKYGAAAISTEELRNRTADVVVREIEKMRKVVSSELSRVLIRKAASW